MTCIVWSSPGLATAASTQNLPGFGDEPFWLVLIKVAAVFVFLMVMALFSIVFERKVVGRCRTGSAPTASGRGGRCSPSRMRSNWR